MRLWLRCVCACALVVLTACPSGDGAAVGAASGSPSVAASASAAKKARARALPAVSMATGTDSVEGVLTSSCIKGQCDRYPGVAPKRFIEAAWRGVVLFTIGETPKRAQATIRNGKGDIVQQIPLQPRTTMSFRQDLKKGTHTVTLTAAWKDREGTWVFGLKVPARATNY